MNPLQTLITTTDFIGHNFAHNLGFLSDEQLAFKPSPTAKSALEITYEASNHFFNMKAALTGGKFGDVPVEVPKTQAQAQELITRAVTEYVEWLKGLDTSNFSEPIDMGFATMSRGQCVTMPVLDMVHHHGQIAYIQTILGDTETHFYAIQMEGAGG